MTKLVAVLQVKMPFGIYWEFGLEFFVFWVVWGRRKEKGGGGWGLCWRLRFNGEVLKRRHLEDFLY